MGVTKIRGHLRRGPADGWLGKKLLHGANIQGSGVRMLSELWERLKQPHRGTALNNEASRPQLPSDTVLGLVSY